jgi:hypothetical protein
MKSALAMLSLLGALALPTTAGAAKITLDDDTWVMPGGYIQAWANMPIDTDEGGVTPDFYIRRAFMFTGAQPTKNTYVFLGGLATNLGKAGVANNGFNIIDAWFEYHLNDQHSIDVGFFRVPFTRHHLVAGSKLHGLDFHIPFIAQSGVASLRDVGIQARGRLMEDHVEYRLAILDGGEPNGLNNAPRIMARATYHVFDHDTGLKVWGAHLGKKKYLSVAAAVDLEPVVPVDTDADGVADDEVSNFSAAADVFADIPMGDNGVVATAVWQLHGADGAMPEGMGVWGDLGYRIGTVEPLVAVEWYDAETDASDLMAVMGGVNWWAKKHDISVKAQVGASQVGGSGDWGTAFTLQNQFAF